MERLPKTVVVLHTILIAVTIGLCLLPSSNADSSIGFLMVGVMGYFVDFPIGVLVEMIRPVDPTTAWVVLSISMFVVLGGLYWFLIFTILTAIVKAVRRKRNS